MPKYVNQSKAFDQVKTYSQTLQSELCTIIYKLLQRIVVSLGLDVEVLARNIPEILCKEGAARCQAHQIGIRRFVDF